VLAEEGACAFWGGEPFPLGLRIGEAVHQGVGHRLVLGGGGEQPEGVRWRLAERGVGPLGDR
jgi:hypothetical protein